jgi:ABC-type branched-subunit amino acid transport system ATPase component
MQIELKQITVPPGNQLLLKDITWQMFETLLTELGENGAGKTTLFNLMTGLIPASSGNLIYQNENISQLKPYQIANQGIARTFQNIRLFGELSVKENVAIARHIHSRSHNPILSLLAGIFALPTGKMPVPQRADRVRSSILSSHRLQSGVDCREGRS